MVKSRDWLVVMTKPGKEKEAKEHLMCQNFEVYLPLWVDIKRKSGAWCRVQAAMFPRYLFVRPIYENQSVFSIRSTRGVSQLVSFNMVPARASEDLIQSIREFETLSNGHENELMPFKKGDQVQVVDGPFKGVSAEVFSCDQQRVILLLQMLGQKQRLEVESNICQVV